MGIEEEDIQKIATSIANAIHKESPAGEVMKEEIPAWKEEGLAKFISHPKPEGGHKDVIGFETHTFLDRLFLGDHGIPIESQIGITGLPSSGKSILVEEIACKVAHDGKKVMLCTSEDKWESQTARFDLQARLDQKANILGLDWKKIAKNLFVLDTVTQTELRDWAMFAQVYRYLAEKEKVDLVLIDSVTLLESYRGALKKRLQELSGYNQNHGITGIFINQRSKEAWDVREMAGGIGLGHILDSTVIVDYGSYWDNPQIKADYYEMFGDNPKRKENLRIVRVLGCRLCSFDGGYKFAEITVDGFLRLKKKEVL